MAKATIKSETGALITVQGTPDEVASILNMFNKPTREAKEPKIRDQTAKKENKKRATASDLVISLKENGYFNKPKSLSEIAGSLEEKGYLYPTTTLSGVMLGLVQKKIVGRKRLEGKWVYGK